MWTDLQDETTQTHVITWEPDERRALLFDHAMAELDGVVCADPGGRWVVDVRHISMLSSNAIAQLIGVVRRVNLANGRLVLANPVTAVASVLRMTRLNKLLPMFDDVPTAIASVSAD